MCGRRVGVEIISLEDVVVKETREAMADCLRNDGDSDSHWVLVHNAVRACEVPSSWSYPHAGRAMRISIEHFGG